MDVSGSIPRSEMGLNLGTYLMMFTLNVSVTVPSGPEAESVN
jgi:hypothetical protein